MVAVATCIVKLLGEGKKLGISEGMVHMFSIMSLLSARVEGICELGDQLHAIVAWAVLQGGIWVVNNSTVKSLFRIHRPSPGKTHCLRQSLPGRVLKDFNVIIQ